MVVFDVTYRCNLSCSYCNRNANKTTPKARELNINQWIKIYEQLNKSNHLKNLENKKFSFSIEGGEPLLRRDLYILIKQIRNDIPKPYTLNNLEELRKIRKDANYTTSEIKKLFAYFYIPKLSITSNGTIRRSDILQNPPDEMCISLHKQVPRWTFINTVNFYSKSIFTTIMLPVSNTSHKAVYDVISSLCAPTFDNLYVFPIVPVGRAQENYVWVRNEQYWLFIKVFLKRFKQVNCKAKPTVEVQIPTIFKAYLNMKYDLSIDNLINMFPEVDFVEHSCNAYNFDTFEGLNQLTINPFGYVSGCCMMSNIPYFYIGNLLFEPLESILSGNKALYFKELFKKARDNSVCHSMCTLQNTCMGGCPVVRFLSHGNIYGQDIRCPNIGGD